MRMAPETQGATYTIFLVAVEEIQNIPCYRAIPNLSRIVKDIPHNVGCVFLATDKTRAREKISIRGAGDYAFGHMAARLTVTRPCQTEF